jgi:hypothetical protein
MKEANWSVAERDLYSVITKLEANDIPSTRRKKIYEFNQRGYTSILLNDDLMQSLDEPNGVKETLHNLVKYSSTSKFVFQKETTTRSNGSRCRPVLLDSATR